MSKTRPTGKSKRDGQLTQDQRYQLALRDRDNSSLKIRFAGAFVLLIGLAVPTAVSIPIAKALAGRETVMTVTVTFVVTIALTGVAATLGTVAEIRRRKVKHLRERNTRLRVALHQLRDRLVKAGLPADVSQEVETELSS